MPAETTISAPEIDVEKIRFIIDKTKEFETQEDVEELVDVDDVAAGNYKTVFNDESSLTAPGEDAYEDEVKNWVNAMSHDDQCQIVALAWVGRGDYQRDEWGDAVKVAREQHNNRTAEYLLGMPLLPDYLEDALDTFDLE